MDQELQKLIEQLQDEKCPGTVLDRVAERISREQTPSRPWRSFLRWAVASACLIGVVVLWQWNARREAQLAAEAEAAQARANRALVVAQTEEAFGYIGQAVIRAAAHTQNTLLKEAVPPLRNSYETVKNKVTNPI